MPCITATKLPALIREAVNAKLSGERLRPYIHIHAAWHDDWFGGEAIEYSDCDVRGVTDEGVERFWDAGCEIVPLRRIMRVEIGRLVLNESGFRDFGPATVYHVIGTTEQAEMLAEAAAPTSAVRSAYGMGSAAA